MPASLEPTAGTLLPERDAAALAWLRAVEAGPTPPWTAEDSEGITREARRRVGERGELAEFLAERARLGWQRLRERGAAPPERVLAHSPWPLITALALAMALLLGWAAGAVGPQGRINILAPPLLALALWNLAVYLVLVLQALTTKARPAGSARGPTRAWLTALAGRGLARAAGMTDRRPGPAQRFLADWSRATAPLQGARAAALLHAGAALVALAALASLYARGLAFEYRAGWDSTFLSAEAVRSLLHATLGPAAALTGLTLPDAAALEALRFSRGGGENAARWIHLHAVTLIAVVVLPRLALAAVAALRARRLARAVPVPEGADLRRWRQAQTGTALRVRVTPFSYQAPAAVRDGLLDWLRREHGEPAVEWDEAVANDPDAVPAASAAGVLRVGLLALTATPERETHGAFLQALAAASASAPLVLIDESGFRRRFPGAEGERRREQRQAAWRKLLADLGQRGEFVDLAPLARETA